tara:strand:+ start:660 stop:860 length:201 start_codon:yes stop_codon:yes gene_type:complete
MDDETLAHFPVSFVVRIRREGRTDKDLEEAIEDAVERAMDSHAGDVGVFASSNIVVGARWPEDTND